MRACLAGILMILAMLGQAADVPEFYGARREAVFGDARLAYYRFGTGTPLLLVTGHGDTMTLWHPAFLDALRKQHDEIVFDWPGMGASTVAGAPPDSMAALGRLVRGLMQTLALKQPDVLGFSMGGSVVLAMAAEDTSLFNHVIAVGGKAGGSRTIAPEPKYFNMLADPNITPEQAVKTLLFPPQALSKANAYLAAIAKLPQEAMAPDALKAQARAVNAENAGPGIWDALGSIRNPVLIINGTEDVLTPVVNALNIAAAIQGAWLVRVQGAGHGVLFQEPDFCARLVTLFLEA